MLSQAKVRKLSPDDHTLVLQTWLRHLRKTFSWLPSEAYFRLYQRQIEDHLQRGLAIALVNPEYARQVFAYAIASPWQEKRALLHFAFVKDYYRGGGLANRLLEELLRELGVAELVATSWSSDLERLHRFVHDYRPDLLRANYHDKEIDP